MKIKFIVAFLLAVGVAAVPAQSQTAEGLYNEGVKLKGDKKIKEAEAKFQSAIQLRPAYKEALYELGWCQNDQKNYTGALSSLRKSRDAGWSHIPKVHFELGYAFEKLDMLDSAVNAYNRCLALKPDYKNAYKQLGYISYAREDYKKAIEQFKQFEEVMFAANMTITDYLYWYRKGFSYNALKEFTEAKAALNKSLELKKDYLNTYLELGFASSRLKQSDEAISWYNKAIETDPKSHIGYNGIGEVYRDYIKDREMAMSWYKKALDVKPKERKACFGIGYCLNAQGKYADAISYLLTAVEQDPDYVAAYVELGYSYYMTNQYSVALDNLKKAMTLNPKNENSRYYATLVYVKQGNRAMAQKMVDELKTLSSKYVSELQQKVNNM